LAEHRVVIFDLRSGLVSGRQCECSAGQHRECKAKQKLAFHDWVLRRRAINWVRGQCYSR
jgi:hypothetical protein